MDYSRYLVIKRENNNIIKFLGESYKRLAKKIISLARKKSPRSIDTEVRLSKILVDLKKNNDDRIPFNIAIKNETLFVEEILYSFPKKNSNKNKIKNIIGILIIVIICVIWVGVGKYFSRNVHLDPPANLKVALEDKQLRVSWDEVDYAEEYCIYYIDNDNKKSASRIITSTNCTFSLDKGKTYVFYVKALETNIFKDSKEVSITFHYD